MTTHYKNYIDGEWVDSARHLDVLNPATEQVVGTIALASAEEVDAALRSARACVDSGVLTRPRPVERARIVHRIGQEILALAEQCVSLLVAENGKTTAEAQTEIEVAARYFEYYAG
ncbi:MAG: aldehyde dehydrogenase (NAD+), partial [Cryomorphaceae bacterium]